MGDLSDAYVRAFVEGPAADTRSRTGSLCLAALKSRDMMTFMLMTFRGDHSQTRISRSSQHLIDRDALICYSKHVIPLSGSKQEQPLLENKERPNLKMDVYV